MKITKLNDHNILKLAANVTSKYIAKCEPEKPANDPQATIEESYAIETLVSVSQIISCIDQLYLSVSMLTGYNKKNIPKNINRYDYIVFGIENYYLRLTSVYDRCLRLANTVFQLGLPERECRESTITKNLHIKKTSVAQSLEDLDRFTISFRFHRNTVAHNSTYSEKELNLLGSYYLVVEHDSEFDKYRSLFKNKTDTYIKKRNGEFLAQIGNLENLVEVYLNAIQISFETRLKSFV